ncbi:hypothetical protein I302_101253 [Kwoniella bestiolae CBS 10118]|uniref:Uncharacterized protein n=1 Tax=Kwoniella bestiolae CBS 10118 TaxID=1296100 RepID=A0A1B9G7C2_9TREE|nr:hypothetical protein I302_04625 [Kwoniella bestiolae CBS 10118]OCF26934.1 hypothetical protein I302_04625 [Kwoniella bestiolae CBS 10118]
MAQSVSLSSTLPPRSHLSQTLNAPKINTPSSVSDPAQIAFERYLAERWPRERGMKGWSKQLPVLWEGVGPLGLGRERDERDG